MLRRLLVMVLAVHSVPEARAFFFDNPSNTCNVHLRRTSVLIDGAPGGTATTSNRSFRDLCDVGLYGARNLFVPAAQYPNPPSGPASRYLAWLRGRAARRVPRPRGLVGAARGPRAAVRIALGPDTAAATATRAPRGSRGRSRLAEILQRGRRHRSECANTRGRFTTSRPSPRPSG